MYHSSVILLLINIVIINFPIDLHHLLPALINLPVMFYPIRLSFIPLSFIPSSFIPSSFIPLLFNPLSFIKRFFFFRSYIYRCSSSRHHQIFPSSFFPFCCHSSRHLSIRPHYPFRPVVIFPVIIIHPVLIIHLSSRYYQPLSFCFVPFLSFCSPLFAQGKTIITINNNNNNNPFLHVPVTLRLTFLVPCLPCITKHVSVIHT